jgi:hypothetical protein
MAPSFAVATDPTTCLRRDVHQRRFGRIGLLYGSTLTPTDETASAAAHWSERVDLRLSVASGNARVRKLRFTDPSHYPPRRFFGRPRRPGCGFNVTQDARSQQRAGVVMESQLSLVSVKPGMELELVDGAIAAEPLDVAVTRRRVSLATAAPRLRSELAVA